jgi:multidrug efflux pump subunit AcrB
MKEKHFKLTNFAIDNKTTVYILTIIIIVFGAMTFNSTPKEKFPEVVFPYFSITTIYPGTSPADIENLVSLKIEKELKGIDGVKKITSKSLQDVSLVLIEFNTDVDIDEAYQDVTEAINKTKSDLPKDILADPDVAKIDLSEMPILFVNLSGDLGLVKIKEYAEELQEEIESLSEISRVDIIGALDREIQINIDLYKMQSAGIGYSQIENIVKMENMTISSGQIKVENMKRTLNVSGEFSSIEEIKNLLIKPGVYLKDIADVEDAYADRESYARLRGEDVITLNVIKKTGQNLIESIDKINEILKEFNENEAPDNLTITTTGDQSTMTRNNVSDLFNTIILGFFLVVIILMFFMGVDNALFVAVSIPLSMLIAFIFIPMVGFTMNMVVLMAFILVLGIVVDNSIVVVENIHRHYMNTPDLPIKEATRRAVGEVAIPVFAGTLTTMAPFIPLAFWQGLMGKFMVYLPVTLVITLAASMFVAFVMNPVFAVSFMKYKENKKYVSRTRLNVLLTIGVIIISVVLYLFDLNVIANFMIFIFGSYLLIDYAIKPMIRKFQESMLPFLKNSYKKVLSVILRGRRPYFVVLSTFAVLILTFVIVGIAKPKIIMFPSGDPNEISVFVRMPSGTDIEKTNEVTKQVESIVFEVLGTNNPDVESVVANVAKGAGQSTFERMTQAKLSKVNISFVEYKYRIGIPTNDYVNLLREKIKGIAGAEIVVDKKKMAPSTGKPINIEISGEDIPKLVNIEKRLRRHIEELKIKGIEELKSDMEVSKPEITLNIDREKAAKLGISTAYIGMTLRTSLFGKEISKIREKEDEYPIKIRLKEEFRKNVDDLLNIQLVLPPKGKDKSPSKIPISAIASVEYTTTYGGIIRKNHKHVITLASNVLEGYNANEIVKNIKKSFTNFKLEKGYEVSFTGEQEDKKESTDFLSKALLIAVALIFLILVFQFNSTSKPIIVLTQVILSMIGVLLGFVIFGMEISVILTGMGIIAVAGIVVKNGIILIDYIDLLLEEKNKSIREVLVEAGATRLTPVLLTAASTIFGLLPLAIGMNFNFVTLFTELNPHLHFGGDSTVFWGPLAWTIIFGLAFATFLTLIIVPSMYYLAYETKVRAKRVTGNISNKFSKGDN